MAQRQNIVGNQSERELAKLLSKQGFWVHIFSRANGGSQPCDIIALSEDAQALIDCKHCDKHLFPLSRIEENQKSCFEMASKCGVECGFAIKYDNKWYWLSWEDAKKMLEKGASSVAVEKLDGINY